MENSKNNYSLALVWFLDGDRGCLMTSSFQSSILNLLG